MPTRYRGANARTFKSLGEGSRVVTAELLAQDIISSRRFWVGDVKYKAERTALYQPNVTIKAIQVK